MKLVKIIIIALLMLLSACAPADRPTNEPVATAENQGAEVPDVALPTTPTPLPIPKPTLVPEPTPEPAQEPAPKVPEGAIELDYFHAGRYSATIVEDDESIFYAKNDGIYKLDKVSGKIERICEIECAGGLQLYKDKVFFMVTEEDYNTILYSMTKGGADLAVVINAETLGDDCGLYNYQIVDDVIYIVNLSYAGCYDLNTGEIRVLIEGGLIDDAQVVDGHLYYIEHGKNFTIYDMNLKTGKTKILLGEGIYLPNKYIYWDFMWVGDVFFYFQRMPQGVFLCKDGNDIVIFDGNVERSMTAIGDQLYFVEGSVYFTKYITLYRCDVKEGRLYHEGYMEGYSNGIRDYTVVNGYVYYSTGYEGEYACQLMHSADPGMTNKGWDIYKTHGD